MGNTTGHGRWGRYRKVNGQEQKLCNGPLHPEEGAWLPFRSFWTYKKGPRADKLMSRCIECEKSARGRDPKQSGLIPISRVWWIFVEIRNRVGKAEACRRIGVSHNMWMRAERGIYINMRRETARKAILALHELRENGVVRHRDSIRRGAAARGEKERVPTKPRDLYKPHGDVDTGYKHKARRLQEGQPS